MVKLLKNSQGDRPRGRRRLVAVATLPSLLTLGNLLSGFAAIYCAMLAVQPETLEITAKMAQRSELFQRMLPSYLAIGAYLLFLAMICDALDGRVARMTRKTSDFGGQLDSLADMVSSGVAPAALMLCLVMKYRDDLPAGLAESKLLWRAVWMAAAVYVSCAALRLARFNVENTHDEAAHTVFKGLPAPGGAAAMATLIVLHEEVIRIQLQSASIWLIGVLPAAGFLLGLLMVGRLPYVHFMNVYLRGRRPISHLVGIVILLAVMWMHPQLVMAVLACGYAASGPVTSLYRRLTGRSAPTPAPIATSDDPDADQQDQHDSRTA